jgi:mRNA-degrading endonuclease RelE of RelBE toxin-antitoxin system
MQTDNPTYSKQAEAYLDKQPARKSSRIKKAVSLLPAGDVAKLRSIKNGYRLRVGSVRVLFEKNGDRIHVVSIDNRGDVYK